MIVKSAEIVTRRNCRKQATDVGRLAVSPDWDGILSFRGCSFLSLHFFVRWAIGQKIKGQKIRHFSLNRHHVCTRWLHKAWFLKGIGSAFGNAEEGGKEKTQRQNKLLSFSAILCFSAPLRFQKRQRKPAGRWRSPRSVKNKSLYKSSGGSQGCTTKICPFTQHVVKSSGLMSTPRSSCVFTPSDCSSPRLNS